MVLVVQLMCKALDEVGWVELRAELRPYVAEPARRFTHRLRCEEPHAHLTSLRALMERLACELRPKHAGTQAYPALCRVLEEHFVVITTGR